MYKLLDFYSETCLPCKMMEPIVDAVVSQVGEVELEKVDIYRDPTRSASFNVAAVPTFVLLNEDGFEVGRKVGAVPLPQFRDWLTDSVT